MRRLCLRLAAVVMLGSLLFGAAEPAEHAGTAVDPWPLYDSPTLRLSWNPYANQRIVKAEVQIATDESFATVVKTIVVDGVDKFPADARGEVLIREHVALLADGLYWVRARVTNDNDKTSAWTPPFACNKNWAVPEPPGGCAIFR